ncbi:allophanate hydrolase [Treponema primitia]|uniref:allophanate hydrolase n=1 Tax=Treponema primitia TaxID=88058 RepID=UPI00025553A1|nr:allophanate hydrolase [Treponema primitia]
MLPKTLSANWLRKQYLTGTLNPEEVIAEIINRVEANREKNIWITEPFMESIKPRIAALKNLDIKDHPLWGIPFAIKDNIDLEGVPTTAGCPAYAYTPKTSAAVVDNLIAAGALPLGKTNLDQFATGLVGTRSPYGEVHNALNGDYISGGSSAGSAVCVALGQAVFALGTDTAGSGRVPAALNNLVGFKPSRGAWPLLGVVPACESLDCVTVFANTTGDCMLVDAAARKFNAADKWSRPLPPPAPEAPQYICLPREEPEFFGDLAAAYQQCWQTFTQAITAMATISGIAIHRIDTGLFQRAASILYGGPWIAERWEALGEFVEARPGDIFPVTRGILSSGKGEGMSAQALFKAMHELETYRQETRQLLAGGVLVLPTAGGTWTRAQVRENPVETNSKLGLYTNHCNLLDLAAIAVPFGHTDDGFPFGVTAFSLYNKEGYLRSLAESIHRLAERRITLAVHGLHMRDMPLNQALLDLGAEFIGTARTAPEYRLFALNTTPAKPGLLRVGAGDAVKGCSIATELWSLPGEGFARLIASIPAPMSFGKIHLNDGGEVTGFLCEDYAAKDAEDISAYGGWKKFLETRV